MSFLIWWILGGTIAFLLHRFTFRKIIGKFEWSIDRSREGKSYAAVVAIWFSEDWGDNHHRYNPKKKYKANLNRYKLIMLLSCLIPYGAPFIALLHVLVQYTAKTSHQNGDLTFF